MGIGISSHHRQDYEDHIKQLRIRAKAAMSQGYMPPEATDLLALNAGERIAPATWMEDLIFSYVWTSASSVPRLGTLLQKVTMRQRDEEIAAADEIFFSAFALDLTSMLRNLDLPDLPGGNSWHGRPFLVTHLLDILYFAGRVPDAGVREWYLSQYANYLCDEKQ